METISTQTAKLIYQSTNSKIYYQIDEAYPTPVLLKVLNADYPTLQQVVQFNREYELTKGLNIRGIRKAYTKGKTANQRQHVLVLEYKKGEPLKHLLKDTTISSQLFLELAISLVQTLGKIHQNNIIHKDINPNNILVDLETKQVVIIDFGISTVTKRKAQNLGNPSTLEGTLKYISPEQTGRINRIIDYRTDLYSLGVTFYEMLTKQLPFDSIDPIELVHAHIAKKPTDPTHLNPDIPPLISKIILKLLAKNADERYQSAFGLKYDLARCLAHLEYEGKIPDFSLGQRDFSTRFQLPQKLYGRTVEHNNLLAAFERVSNGNKELLLIAGYSGVGKSALVKEIHRPITEKRGYFIEGKFDQLQRNVPYFAWIQAFRELVDQLLTESTNKLQTWRTALLQALRGNGRVLTEVIPNLALIIGKQPPISQLDNEAAQGRFNRVFRSFVKAIAKAEHPLVIFIDDLQWADMASLNLLEVLLTDESSKHLLIVGAYRDNEVSPTHPFILTLKQLGNVAVNMQILKLQNLSQQHIEQLLVDTFQMKNANKKRVKELAELIYKKTNGNAFFTTQFLQSLYEKKLIAFNFKQSIWQWELSQIDALAITDNVITLMTEKIKQLPAVTQNILKLAACVGNKFSTNTLRILSRQSSQEIQESLAAAIKEQLIMAVETNYHTLLMDYKEENLNYEYRFTHDRIQQAVYSLLNTTQKKNIHLKIGRLLLKSIQPAQLGNYLFDIVNHFKEGISLVQREQEKIQLAHLYLQAAQLAKAASAFQDALQYLQVGKQLLPMNSWEVYYQLTLAIYTQLGECAYLSKLLNFAEQYLTIAFIHTKNDMEKVNIYLLKISFFINQGKNKEALELGMSALNLLGISLNIVPSAIAPFIQKRLQFINTYVQQHGVKTLIDLPLTTDTSVIMALQVLNVMIPAARFVNPKIVMLITLLITELSIKHGNIDCSAAGYCYLGLILAENFGQLAIGYEFGQVALAVNEKYPNILLRSQINTVFSGLLSHWQTDIKDSIKKQVKAYVEGVEQGQYIYACYNSMFLSQYNFWINRSLAGALEESEKYAKFVWEIEYTDCKPVFIITRQLILALQGKTQAVDSIEDDSIQEIDLEIACQSSNIPAIGHWYYIGRLMLSYTFKDYEKALEWGNKAAKMTAEGISMGSIIKVYANFYHFLTLTAIYQKVTVTQQVDYLEKITALYQKMKLLADNCPINFLAKALVMEAELKRITNKKWEAAELYEQAIQQVRRQENISLEAIINELAGEFWLQHKQSKLAKNYLEAAHSCYSVWGATAKVLDLDNKYPTYFQHHPLSTDSNSVGITILGNSSTSKQILDLNSIIKVSQSISSSINFEKLLKQLMQTVIENAGAEKGILILEKNGSWSIEASCNTMKKIIETAESTTIQELPIQNKVLSKSIVNYVIRTRKVVVIHSAIEDEQFINDRYIKSNHPKSILCMPLLNQNKLVGILYLENNLMNGAFNQKRIAVLDMLSSQMAISLINATLYHDLETSLQYQRTLTDAYSRFVPNQFLSFLEKDSIVDVQLGDQVEKEMTVFFSDIRGFTSLSEKMTPQQNFNFINAFLSRLEPIISEYHGFIDKYIGDAIMALFPRSADDAVKSAINMLREINLYNESHKKRPIKVGIGLNTGRLMLGTVGGKNRMDGTVISDAVNLGARVEGMTKMYGIDLLITEHTYKKLAQPTDYKIRMIDKVKVSGKTKPVTVYEVFDGDLEEVKYLKTQSLQYFVDGLIFYTHSDFTEALLSFQQALEIYPADKAAKVYYQRCKHFLKHGIPETWEEGVMALSYK